MVTREIKQTDGADLDRADEALRDGTMRERKNRRDKGGYTMTQFALARADKDIYFLKGLNDVSDSFLLKATKKLFPDAPLSSIYKFDVDDLMLDAQRAINENIDFESTKLFQSIKKLTNSVDELIFWYGSEYDDLDYVHNESELLSKLKESVSDSFCEVYIHYKRNI